MGERSPAKEKDQKEAKSQPRSGKGFTYEVVLLDGEHVNIELDKNADGSDLFEKVCEHLDLIEKEYFGLQYVDDRIPHPLKCWLSPDKKISKQKKKGPWLFDFALKFYPPDPTQLRESLTRWLVTLQTRRDILYGKLPATFLTQAMLGSYNVQADVGDYDSTEHHGIDYIRDIPFAQNQTTDLLEKIVELHRQHKGQTPDEAELNYLENAKKLSMYGVDMHDAQDVNNVDILIGVCASGLQVYRDKLRISRFVWPKILKISYKRNHFYIKVRPADNSRMENSVSFKLPSHRLAKRLWKICVEHHAFFRLREADQPNNAAMFPRLGSKFRYSGRTLYQARHSTQNLDRPDPYFERSQPARNTYAAPSNRSRSVDELTNRPDYWKDDMDVQRRPATEARDGREKRDHIGQPTVISMLGLPEGMKPVESEEEGRQLEPGANQSIDGPDRLDRKPGDEDSTLEREGRQGTMGLTPAELQKKAREDEKERKKREKEEEKRRKKEEEERKKAEKAAKKGKGKGVEDRTDLMGGGDATQRAPGHVPGSYADQEGVAAYPGYGPGVGVGGAGDMSGVVGEETWIDNKMTFEPVVPPKKESRDSLKSPQFSDIDHTMPFFSPAATSTVGRPRSGKVPPPISPKPNNTSFDDSFSRRDCTEQTYNTNPVRFVWEPPTVATESVQYQPNLEEVPVPTKNVPLVKTETRTVTYEREGFPFGAEEDGGILVSASSHSTRMQTIETTTYKTEKDGVQETRVEHKVVLSSTDDDFDYDQALAEAIRSVTEFNPDMSVERIECVQQIEEVKDK